VGRFGVSGVTGDVKAFFDGRIFTLQQQGGISRLFFELMRSFGQTRQVDQILFRGAHIDRYPFRKEWFRRYYGLRMPRVRGLMLIRPLDDIGLELVYRANAGPDLIYHSSYYRLPRRARGPLVVHTYDMIHELYGGDLGTKVLKKKALQTADLIISISESTKKDLCELHGIDPRKVAVAYPGVSSVFHRCTPLVSTVKRDDVRPYMLYVGNRGWYKNFDLLFDTFVHKKYFYDFDLVLVGGERKLSDLQQRVVSDSMKKRTWLRHEFCNDGGLAQLYANATVFVCTSLYEGFGIPLVEAMACGCPVIGPKTSSVPEVVGDAALLFDPKDVEDLARQMDKVISDQSLRAGLVERGHVRATRFSWDAMAQAVYEGYSTIT
jgi:glycosyltransferase involved in cell wall biosynthesis